MVNEDVNKEIPCKCCGKCCYVIENNRKIKCRMLKILGEGKTKCRRYYGRLGHRISKNWKCGMREKSYFNYEGCPYNTLHPEKPMFEDELAKLDK